MASALPRSSSCSGTQLISGLPRAPTDAGRLPGGGRDRWFQPVVSYYGFPTQNHKGANPSTAWDTVRFCPISYQVKEIRNPSKVQELKAPWVLIIGLDLQCNLFGYGFQARESIHGFQSYGPLAAFSPPKRYAPGVPSTKGGSPAVAL